MDRLFVLASLLIFVCLSQNVQLPLDQNAEILTPINSLRAKYCVGRLTWDFGLATLADATAKNCDANISGVPGVTLAAAFGREVNIQPWLDQEANYNCSAGQCVAGKKCASYTQVVWDDTQAVGCARYQCFENSPFSNQPGGPWRFLVCYYAIPGNVPNIRPFPVDQCKNCAPTVAPRPTPAPPTPAPLAPPTPEPTAVPTSPPTSSPGVVLTLDPQLEILAPINKLRATYCLRPLAYSPVLAQQAARFAQRCELNTSLTALSNYGETLAAAFGQEVTVDVWLSEQADFNCTALSCLPGKPCKAFLQVVWSATSSIGCARYLCPENSPFSGKVPWRFLVCQYQMRGLIANESVFPVSQCRNCTFAPTGAPTPAPTGQPVAPSDAPTEPYTGPPTESPTAGPPTSLPVAPNAQSPSPQSPSQVSPSAPSAQLPSSSPSDSPTDLPGETGGLSQLALVGIILGSICGFLLLVLLLIIVLKSSKGSPSTEYEML